MIRPSIIVVQGAVVNDVIGVPLNNLDFVKVHIVQKIPQFASGEMKAKQLDTLIAQLKPYVLAERLAQKAM
jgi:hypothetical protein